MYDSSGYRVPGPTWRQGGGPEISAQLRARANLRGTLLRGAVLNGPGHTTPAALGPLQRLGNHPNADNLAAAAIGGDNSAGLPGRMPAPVWNGEPGPNSPTVGGLIRPWMPGTTP